MTNAPTGYPDQFIEFTPPSQFPELLPQHLAQLRASGLTPEVIRARGYRSVEKKGELLELGFSEPQAIVPAMLIPIHDVFGRTPLYQSRPDNPRISKNGKRLKYETPRGATMSLDVPPAVREQLGDPKVPLYFTEGAKKADAGVSHGIATIALLGVWNWRGTNNKGGKTALADFDAIALNGRQIYIAFDSDVTTKEAVRKALRRLRDFLKSRGARVSVLRLPDGENGAKVGLDDFLASGRSTENLLACRENEESLNPADESSPSQSKLIVDLVLDNYDLGVDRDGNAFVVSKSRPGLALMFRGSRKVLQGQISAAFLKRHRKVTNSGAIADALLALEGQATESDPRTVNLRVARDGQDIVLDLGRRDAKVVRIGPGGWSVTHEPEILFRRTALTDELPLPERGGSLDELRSILNASPNNFELLKGWIIAGYIPDLPHSILLLDGQQGTGKSCAAEFSVGLVDPSSAPKRSQPGNPRQWAIAANASWGILVDNVSSIPEWWSDALCKAVTGDGWIDRALYSDSELTVLQYRRVIAMTSIHPGVLRGDLAERLLIIELDPIRESNRRAEDEIRRLYFKMRPRLLGAALTLLSGVLRELPTVTVEKLPRMADFGRVLAAIDAANWTVRTVRTVVFDTYREHLERLAEMVVDSDPIAEAITQLMDEIPEWIGTASQLRTRISSYLSDVPIPKSPRAMSGKLRRVVPALKATGIEVDFDKEGNRDRTRLITIRKERGSTVQTVRTVRTPQDLRSGDECVGRSSDGRAYDANPDRPRASSDAESEHGLGRSEGDFGRSSDGCDAPTVRNETDSSDPEEMSVGPGRAPESRAPDVQPDRMSGTCRLCGGTREWALRQLRHFVCLTCHAPPGGIDPSKHIVRECGKEIELGGVA